MIEGLASLASAFGLSASAGLNAYIPMLIVSLLGRFTSLVQLEKPWDALTSWWIIGLLAVLFVIETLADKMPAVDSVNDVIQTIVRPTAGAVLFAATTQSAIHVHPVLALACGVIIAGSVHAVKAGARPVLTATTGGTANPLISTLEDVLAIITSFIAIIFPYLIVIWVLLLALLIYLIARRYRERAATG